MKKVLAIIGSQRHVGNCEIMVKEIGRHIPVSHQLRFLRLPDFNLSYCNGCYRCLAKDEVCVLKDDLSTVLQAIAEADALVLAVPTYFLGAHSCLKVFIDRGISFYGMAQRLWGKPSVGIGVAGIEGKEGSTLLDIERFFTTIQAKSKLNRVVYGALPGEAIMNEKNREIAAEMASALFGEPEGRKAMSCSICGGVTFRFLEGNKVRCMLCSNSGVWVDKPGGAAIEIHESSHEILIGEQEALKHRDWLRGMVGRYGQEKEQLQKAREPYRDEEPWIKPLDS